MMSRVYLLTISRVPESHPSEENSEPLGPPYQPPYAPHPSYGPTLSPAAVPVPMPVPSPGPSGAPRGISSSQYPITTGDPFAPPAQSRALHPVGRNPRSQGRQPLISHEMDAPEPKRRDWRCHPQFKHSRCTGRRKALCVRFSALALLIDVEQRYR